MATPERHEGLARCPPAAANDEDCFECGKNLLARESTTVKRATMVEGNTFLAGTKTKTYVLSPQMNTLYLNGRRGAGIACYVQALDKMVEQVPDADAMHLQGTCLRNRARQVVEAASQSLQRISIV